jgi:TnpA family transposase
MKLDEMLDKRLVRTFVRTIIAIVVFRQGTNGLLLSELGSYILNAGQAPAGTKRLSNLLRSKRWTHEVIEQFLWQQGQQRLYRPTTGDPDAYPNLQPILTRAINWIVIEQQYDELIKLATALRLGTADAESILRRFTRSNVQHPTYKALCELGKALKTIFLCDFLRLESLRREIHEGLQVIETWNSANDFILYGKGGEFASNKVEDHESLMLSLHLLQVSLVYVNTLMIQQVLAEPEWQGRLTATDLRALTPLKWQHVNPYGTFTLNMQERLPLQHAP